jgi:Cu2+-containing amine oxidase/cation diffusion facilitator CzcD-associated flavoprotein CzcO
MTQATTGPVGTPVRHPLAPLTVSETAAACRLALASGVGPGTRVVYCALAEPPKEAVLGWDGRAVPREALCVLYERPARTTWLVTVSLDDQGVSSRVAVPGVQPPIMTEEWLANAEQIKVNPEFRAAMARRGITDMSKVQVDPWPAGNFGLDIDASGRRLARGVAYVLDGPGCNPYARPVENLVAISDRDNGEVIEVIDGEPVPVPRERGRYDAASMGVLRELAPLAIIQPEGPGFTVDDGCMRWGPWQMRVSMDPIEGLVLHEICYIDGERVRPIIYRASVAEMIVPYGSTSASHWWKNAFDAGDGGLGKVANSLEPGCDCLGEIVYLDAVQVDEDGTASTLPQAICLHEEDYGILWKHNDVRNGTAEVRRSRRMVVSFIATVSNYDYGFFWYFYLDGTIQAEVKLTGIIQTQAVLPGTRVPYANPVTPELAGPHHQHIFCFRLDMCLDGQANSVYEVDAVPVPQGPDNPYGNAFTARATLLKTECAAQRMAAADRARYWKIVNHGSLNACGEPVGYKLIPQASAPLLAQATAAISVRAAFATKHLWVTQARADERRPAGDFPNQHPGGAGLPAWTAADRPVTDTDIVLWHTVGATHFCQPEDFPVMSCEYVGFTLKPAGFFDRNPAINLAPLVRCHLRVTCSHRIRRDHFGAGMTATEGPTGTEGTPADKEALRRKYRQERDKRLRPDGTGQYLRLTGRFARYLEDPHTPRAERAPKTDHRTVVFIGGGFAGLVTGARLKEAGVDDVRIIEKGGDFGGTWYWNRFPGAQCDTASFVYMPLLEETGHMPTEKYARAPEIFEHCQRIGKHYSLYDDALFHTKVENLEWDGSRSRWIIRTDRGDEMTAQFVAMGIGPLDTPKLPGIQGIQDFAGCTFHTSRWDYDYTGGDYSGAPMHKLADKRVAVIGSGATAVQCIPHLARACRELYVFQRTPSSVDVRENRPTDPEWFATIATPGWQQRWLENFTAVQMENWSASQVGMAPEDLVMDGWTSIARRVRSRIAALAPENRTAAAIVTAFEDSDYERMEEIRARIDSIVEDPETAWKLKAWYRQWCKRPCFHDEYLQAYNRPNTHLVDTDGKGVERITQTGVVAAGQEYPVDCIIYASGFEWGTDYVRRAGYDMIGRDGVALSAYWAEGMRTLHGIHIHGFPNAFVVQAPQGAFVILNFPHNIAESAKTIVAVIKHALDHGFTEIEATRQAEDAWINLLLSGRGQLWSPDCTPGIYNYEGQDPGLRGRLRAGYPLGPVAYFTYIDRWRKSGAFGGLEFR